MKKLPILGFYGYWVILTYFSVIAAAAGIYNALNGNIKIAVVCLMVSGICDMFDGSVARMADRTDQEKGFGIQIDSLADIIGFGILPAVIGYAIFTGYSVSVSVSVSGYFGAARIVAIISVYVLAALIRLAYYNVTEAELQSKDEKRKYYEGLPVTSVALIVPIVYSACMYWNFPLWRVYNKLLLLLSLAFVMKVKIPKLKLRYMIGLCPVGLSIVIYILLLKGF